MGDRHRYIQQAVSLISQNGMNILKKSAIIETSPQDGPKQGKFLNAVIKAKTEHTAESLLRILLGIERRLGRVRNIKNGPRNIDIDILLFDDIKLVSRDLMIPHPRMFKRDFVMGPLKEIDPRVCASYIL